MPDLPEWQLLAAAGALVLALLVQHRVERRAAERRRALDQQLHLTQRLESLGQLAGGVAHDFNNLLGVILGYAHIITRRPDLDPEVRADVERIEAAAERAVGLTRQLLDFGRLDTATPQILDLNAVVEDVLALLTHRIGDSVDVVLEAAPDLPGVRIDRGLLEQVLVNLAVNARDAMPKGGRLTISTSRVGGQVRLEVRDEGEGMTAEVAAHAFDPFFTTKPRAEGTGLGLATVYGIVTGLDGSVEIRSSPGQGTSVIAYLPAFDEPPAA